MSDLRRYGIYFLWLIGFFILSDFLINVGLNSIYKEIKRNDDTAQVSIYQAEATAINGRIRGIIKNPQQENLGGKYMKVELYSKRNVFLGKKYIQIEQDVEDMQSFELHFKLKNVASYNISIVDEKEPGEEIDLLETDLTPKQIVIATLLTFLVFGY